MAPWRMRSAIAIKPFGQLRISYRSRRPRDHPTTLHALLIELSGFPEKRAQRAPNIDADSIATSKSNPRLLAALSVRRKRYIPVVRQLFLPGTSIVAEHPRMERTRTLSHAPSPLWPAIESKTSRTFCHRLFTVNGFCRNAIPGSKTP